MKTTEPPMQTTILHRLDTLKDVFTTTFGTLGLLRTAARVRHLFRPGPRRRGAYCGHADSKLECVPNEVYCFGPFACLVLVGLGWLGSGRVGLGWCSVWHISFGSACAAMMYVAAAGRSVHVAASCHEAQTTANYQTEKRPGERDGADVD